MHHALAKINVAAILTFNHVLLQQNHCTGKNNNKHYGGLLLKSR